MGGRSGTAILINNPQIRLLWDSKMLDVDGRVIAIDAMIAGNKLHFLNTYGPNESTAKVPFLNRLHLYLNSNVSILWVGDHNLTINPRIDRSPVRFNNDRGGKEFSDMLDVFDLKDVCRTLFPRTDFFTWRSTTAGCLIKSRIDMILVSHECTVLSYVQENTGFSDHDLVKSAVSFKSNIKSILVWNER